jgi:hypothetical protein
MTKDSGFDMELTASPPMLCLNAMDANFKYAVALHSSAEDQANTRRNGIARKILEVACTFQVRER